MDQLNRVFHPAWSIFFYHFYFSFFPEGDTGPPGGDPDDAESSENELTVGAKVAAKKKKTIDITVKSKRFKAKGAKGTGEEKGKNKKELLELEMRAKAIKSLLEKKV